MRPLLPMTNWPENIPPFSTEIALAVTLPSREAFRWIGEQGLTTLLIATHSLAIAASAHRVIRLGNGEVVGDEEMSVHHVLQTRCARRRSC